MLETGISSRVILNLLTPVRRLANLLDQYFECRPSQMLLWLGS